MELSRGILKNFAQITNDSSNNKASTSVHATAVVVDGVKYAKIDGSTVLTPISETTDVQTGDRILVTIENHKAVVIGNFTYPPSARNEQKALEESERASSTANSAIEKAGEAQSLAADANTLSSQANTVANQAVASAQQASTLAQNAQTAASEANTKSDSAIASANDSLAKSAAAQKELDALKAEVETVQGDVADARAEAIASVNTVKEELSANYAKKTEVTAVEGSLKAEITKSVSELQSTISEQYTAKSESVALEERLQSQITQNADSISSVVSRTTKLETDTSEAQKQIDAAKASAANAQSTADAAQAAAKTAQDSADAAQSAADTAQANATAAQTTADAAKAKAEAANTAAANAQSDLDAAKANLTEVTNRVGATEEEIAAAQQAVDDAQAAADQAIANAASANTAAANAQTAADKAKTDAANAQSAANTAQTKADSASAAAATAQAAADKAQADADALKSRVTTCETNISQNAEAITLRATKTELTNAVNGVQIGGRNLLVDTKDFKNNWGCVGTSPILDDDGFYYIGVINSWSSYIYQFIKLEIGTYTLSFYAKASSAVRLEIKDDSLNNYGLLTVTINGIEWKKYVVLLNITKNDYVPKIAFLTRQDNTKIYVKKIKFERGNKATDWTPAPEDQDAATQAVADNLASNYYNKTQTDAQIKVKADSILSTVSTTYQTKDAMGNYSTTAQMNSAIEQSATSIKSEVSATYATNTKVDSIQIGGRNYYHKEQSFIAFSDDYTDGSKKCPTFIQNAYGCQNGFYMVGSSLSADNPPLPGRSSTVRLLNVIDSDGLWTVSFWGRGSQNTNPSFYVDIADSLSQLVVMNSDNSWKKFELTFEVTNYSTDPDIYTFVDLSYITWSYIYIKDFKVEKGNKATDWTPAPEDVDSSIASVKTIAEQTATKFSWLVKSGTSESNMVLTDTLYSLVAENINLTGKVTFSCLDSAAQQKINTAQSTADTAKSNAATAQSTANTANTNANNALITITMASGKMLFTDPSFTSGYNEIAVYNNNGNGTVTVTRISRPSDSPVTSSNYVLQIQNAGTSSPSCGGFRWSHASRANAIFIYKIIAKLPNGRRLEWYSNSTGNDPVSKWIANPTGNGSSYQEYICYLKCGYTGSFYDTGYFALSGEVGSTSSPVTWYVAYATCYDCTNVNLDYNSILGAWCYNNDVTYINGGKIYTGTVTADKISVTSLEAICAKIGGFTIGSSALYNNTTALAGAENSVYLGTDGISCGTTFKVTKAGAVTATSGTVGGFTLSSTELTNTANNSGIHFRYSGSTPAYNDIYIGGSNHNILVSAYDSLNKAKYEIIIGGDNPYAIEIKPSYLSADAGFVTDKSLFIDNYGIYKESGETIEFRNDLAFPNAGRVGTRDNPTGNHIIKNNRGIYFKTTDGSDYRGIGMSSADQLLIGMTSNASVSALLGCSIVPSSNDSFNLGSTSSVFNYVYTSTMRIGLNTYSEANAAINTKWKDGNTHNILTRGTDGLTSAIGWVGSSSYATVLKLNSRTVQVVNSSGTSTLSDGRLKKDFRNLEAWERFYLDLEPIAYKYKDGSSGRNHMGFVAQQVEKALLNNGLTTNDFAGLVKYDVNPDDEDSWHGYKTEYGLIYTEFTALNTYMTQKNAKTIKDLSHRFTVLDGKVNSTYARMASAEERIDKLEKENKQLREEIAQLKMAS